MGAVLVTRTVVVVEISITGRVARLVKYNYGATKINLAGRKTKAVSTPGRIKGEKETSSAGNEPCTSPRS